MSIAKHVYDTVEKENAKQQKDARMQKIVDKLRLSVDYTEVLKEMLNDIPIYYDKNKIWWLWDSDNNKWEMTDETDLLIIIKKALDVPSIAKNHIKNEIIESLKIVSRENKPKDPHVNWIQFKNYVYDIKTGERIEPTSDYFFTNPIKWNLGDIVDTPTIDKLFKDWVGDKYVEQLYEIIAYSLYRDYPIHRIFCLIGSGRNGKSKFIELLNRFIGVENSSSTELDQLIVSRFEVAKLYKKLVCCMGETNYNAIERTALLKKLTGQDLIGYEFKQKNPFDDYNYAKIIISTNSIPITHDKTDGFYRRWLIVDFPNKFPEGINILDTIPDQEYENLALKSVVILKMLLEQYTFTNELSIEDKRVIYEEKSNPLTLFLKEKTLEDIDEHIFKYDFNSKLSAWLNKNGYRNFSDKELNGLMREKYKDMKKYEEDSRYWAWIGLKWKNDEVKEEIVQEVQEVQ